MFNTNNIPLIDIKRGINNKQVNFNINNNNNNSSNNYIANNNYSNNNYNNNISDINNFNSIYKQ